ncbi:MAG: hypothetical protein B7C54_06405 [Acidimicrobiales bacterium mtb01]|nr:hypothetical protein [Actinomycetota bacterium]TEX46816.1 MAG: hypothetical protein B7C54_06405 [Acidimicrobiales bacterium mtb01]
MTEPLRPRRARDRGQAGILCLAVIAVLLIATQQMVRLGGTVADAARAQSVADAVAVAAVQSGEAIATRIALRNDAEVESIVERPGAIEVVVNVGGVLGRARASNTDLP